jgi:hypothetical protein
MAAPSISAPAATSDGGHDAVDAAAAACDDAVHAEAMELAATQLANVVNATSCVHEERHKYLRARGNTSRNSARV